MKIRDVPQSGRVGAMVSFKTPHGQFRRRYVIPKDPRTARQVSWRSARRRVAPLWGKLAEEQRAAWDRRAKEGRTRKRLGQSGRLSGYLLFLKLNCNLAALGLPPVLDPPVCPAFPANPVAQLIVTNNGGKVALKLKVSGQRGEHILVRGTRPQSAGVTYVDHFTNLCVLPDPVGGWSDITEAFVKKYRVPRAGLKVFIQTAQQIDGWRDGWQQVRAIVPGE
jgi:hypothetical protein